MKWETVKISNESKGSTIPYASVGRGRITFNSAACGMLDHHENYQYVEFLKGKMNNSVCIGVRFLKPDERTENSVPIKRKSQKGKMINCMEISCKGVIGELFGPSGTADKTTRYKISKDDDANNILIVY